MDNDQISKVLTIVLVVLLLILFALVVVFIMLSLKRKNNNKTENVPVDSGGKNTASKPKETSYNKQSIFDFM